MKLPEDIMPPRTSSTSLTSTATRAGTARLWRRLLLSAACALGARIALAAEGGPCEPVTSGYPSRPVTLVVGFPPGGQTGQIGRFMADALTARLGQPVVVENRAGAGGTIGAALVAQGAADGHLLYLATMGTHAVNAALYPKLAYDHLRDFKAVAYVTTAPNVLVTRSDAGIKTLQGLIDAAKAKPRGIDIALPGNGTSPHLSSALFESMAGIRMQSIMYKGNAPALTDLLGGQIEFMVDSVTTALPHIQRGALRALGVTTATRSPLLPDVPTISEFVPGYEVNPWWGIVAPAATPAAIVARLNCEINQALKDPALIARFGNMGAVTRPMTAEAFSRHIVDETAKWERVVKTAGIRLE